jgi:hypothetical protein
MRIEKDPPAFPHPSPPFAQIEVADAAGRSVQASADELVAPLTGFELEREDVTLGGEAAVMLDRLPGQELGRGVLAVHAGKLCRLAFLLGR